MLVATGAGQVNHQFGLGGALNSQKGAGVSVEKRRSPVCQTPAGPFAAVAEVTVAAPPPDPMQGQPSRREAGPRTPPQGGGTTEELSGESQAEPLYGLKNQ
jgi:hypothetical protein